MTRNFFYTALLIALTAVYNPAQTPSPQPTPQASPTPVSLETILTEAEKRTVSYRENFNSLLADETKTFEEFDKKGKPDDKRTVESNFLVYQSAKDPEKIFEYRNVVRVDGKTVGGDKRAEDFFEKVLKSTTADKELDRVRTESNRYDKGLDISGLTLNQAVILAPNLRPVFDFKLLASEIIEGNEVFVVEYRQNADSPDIAIGAANENKAKINIEVGKDKNLNGRLRGKLWIDARTFQLWREESEVIVQPNVIRNPLTAQTNTFEYQKSDFGILVPKKIIVQSYFIKIKNKGEEVIHFLQTRATFEYTKFTKSDVEVKSGEVKSSKENQ